MLMNFCQIGIMLLSSKRKYNHKMYTSLQIVPQVYLEVSVAHYDFVLSLNYIFDFFFNINLNKHA